MLTDYIPSKTTTTTHDAYADVPLATHSSSARGNILERVAMRVMEEKMGETAHPPPPGTCVNGAKRGRNREAYDFTIAGRRVEVKSAQLKWNSSGRRWQAQWQNVKRDAYDDLLLVLYTPFGVRIFVHDHVYGVSTSGKLQGASGGNVVVRAPHVTSISEALDVVLGKLSHMHYATVPFTDFTATTTTTHDAYADVPLATHSSQARGNILERVAMRVMEERSGETAHPPAPGTRVNGAKRGRNSEAYDFTIAGRRVEVKSAQLAWDSGTRRVWRALWQNIKREAYDDLLLVLYTPFGVHIFVHDHTYGVSTNGILQGVSGGYVTVVAPRNMTCISEALDVVLGKLSHMHYATLTYS